jgi:hypothetical protein
VVANINYAQKTVVMKDVFATWVVGYNLDTKDFYPLRERKWELSVSSLKSAPQNPQLPFFAAQTAVTIVPVRSPFANDTLDGVPAQNVVENPATVVNP